MKNDWELTADAFNGLLVWLDADRIIAGNKYETIRRRLIRIFTCRGCYIPEELADETINRVARKVQSIAGTYTGDPAYYFYGVAQKVFLEHLRRRPMPEIPPQLNQSEESEREYECLEKCMDRLSEENRKLVLEYYQSERQAKIDHRKLLAERLGIAVNALRIRMCRLRQQLQQCMAGCLEDSSLAETP